MKFSFSLIFLFVLFAGGSHHFSVAAERTSPVFLTPADSLSPSSRRPFEGHFHCAETIAPGFEFLGPMNAYLKGPGIYGTWMSTRVSIDGKKAVVRFSNDIGSESQDIELVQVSDSILTYRARGGNAIRKAVGRKLVKVTDQMTFRLK